MIATTHVGRSYETAFRPRDKALHESLVSTHSCAFPVDKTINSRLQESDPSYSDALQQHEKGFSSVLKGRDWRPSLQAQHVRQRTQRTDMHSSYTYTRLSQISADTLEERSGLLG